MTHLSGKHPARTPPCVRLIGVMPAACAHPTTPPTTASVRHRDTAAGLQYHVRMNGIACAGNWIVDQIKIIDCWPEQGELSNILSADHGIGGSPANVLTDLRTLGFPAPMIALGCIGDDEYGRLILSHCVAHGIDASLIRVLPGLSTSYTDVMTVADTGGRTFFHDQGANALFTPEHVDMDQLVGLGPKIFHLGYLLLLDGMDAEDPEYGTVAARLLADVRSHGIETSIDVVSEALDRFPRIVGPALKHVDYCVVNEYEAERTTGVTIRHPSGGLIPGAMEKAARALLSMGVLKTVVIHCPEGGLWVDAVGATVWSPALTVPHNMVVSTVGAGDAFCAGVLYGIHEGWMPERCLAVGNATAATSLCEKNTTDGVRSLDDVLEFARTYAPDS